MRDIRGREIVEVACDESGSEGELLIGGETDVFAHAGVRLEPEDARACVREIRDRIQSPALEYKSNHLLRPKHRQVLAWLLGADSPLHGRAQVHLVDKTYFLTGVLADLLGTEARTLSHRGPERLGLTSWQSLLGLFNNLLRVKSRRGVTSVDAFLQQLAPLDVALSRTRLAAFRAEPVVLNPLFPALERAVGYWSAGGRAVSIVHDEQLVLTEARVTALARGGSLAGLRLVDSRSDHRVQVADFLAGVARKIASEELNGRGDAELTALLRSYVDSESVWGDDRSWARLQPMPTR